MNTRERILDKGLELMNKTSPERVTLREIAQALRIRQSNITYYFPSKRDLVHGIVERMMAECEAITAHPGNMFTCSFADLHRMLERSMDVHLKYRCILLNFGAVVSTDPALKKYYVDLFKSREGLFESIFALLSANGYVKKEKILPHWREIMGVMNMMGIYWVQEAAIYSSNKPVAVQRKQYVRLFFQVFIPYLTKKGERNLLPLLK